MSVVEKRLEPGETVTAWCRVWYSRPVRLQWASARFRDFAVLTDRRLMMYSAGWLTRRPRRRVLADRLDDLMVASQRDTTALYVTHPSHPAMVLEFGKDDTSQRIATTLLNHRTHTAPAATVGDAAWPS